MATSDAPGFRILNLHVQDFRGIDSLKLDFTDGNGEPLKLVVLAGDNGCGKTSVLEAILMLVDKQHLLPKDRAPTREQVRFGATQFNLRAGLRFTYGTRTEDFVSNYQGDHFEGPYRETLRGWHTATSFLRLGAEYTGSKSPSVEYFSSRREPESLGATPEPSEARSSAESRRLPELKRRLINTYYRSLRSPKPSVLASTATPFDRIQNLWTRFSASKQTLDVIPVSNNPGSGDEVVLRDAQLPIPADVTSLEQARQLAPSRPDIPRLVSLDRLSSGQIALFTFAGPLIFRDQPADFVLIDEPEQHLHVQWQRLLLPALRELSPTSQFFVATHSTEILEAALSYERFILVSDGDPRAQLPEGSGDAGSADGAAERA